MENQKPASLNILQKKIVITPKAWVCITILPTLIACIWSLWFLYSLAFSNRHTEGESLLQLLLLILPFCSFICAIQALRGYSQKVALGALSLALLVIGLIGGYRIGTTKPDYGGESNLYTPPLTQMDPYCDGVTNELYDIGYGFEHAYKGEITKDMPVIMVLSCDHTRLTITGSVTQIINGKDVQGNDTGEIADTSSGSYVVDVDTDYNFDGYNDLASIMSNGYGFHGVDSYAIFLFDPTQSKFVYNIDLGKIKNILVNEETKTVIEGVCGIDTDDEEVCQESYIAYQWKNGKLMELKK